MKLPKLKNKAFTIDLGVYPFTVFVCFGDVSNLRKQLESYKYKIHEEDITKLIDDVSEYIKNCSGKAIEISNGNVILWFNTAYWKEEPCHYANTISHESLHCTEMILETIGMKLNRESSEAYCYLHGYIVEKIFEQI
jgi:hypothetical protein